MASTKAGGVRFSERTPPLRWLIKSEARPFGHHHFLLIQQHLRERRQARRGRLNDLKLYSASATAAPASASGATRAGGSTPNAASAASSAASAAATATRLGRRFPFSCIRHVILHKDQNTFVPRFTFVSPNSEVSVTSPVCGSKSTFGRNASRMAVSSTFPSSSTDFIAHCCA